MLKLWTKHKVMNTKTDNICFMKNHIWCNVKGCLGYQDGSDFYHAVIKLH